MRNTRESRRVFHCLGSGLLALDIVYPPETHAPAFLSIGGSCGNVLSILNAFGAAAIPVAQLGRDAAGKVLVTALRRRGIDTRYVIRALGIGTPIIIHTLVVDSSGGNKHAFSFQCPETGIMLPRFRPILTERARDIGRTLRNIDIYYSDRVISSTRLLAESARKRGALVFLEPSARFTPAEFLRTASLAHVLKVSNEIVACNDGILDEVWNPIQIVTRGANGLWYRLGVRKGIFGPWHRLNAVTVRDVIDPAGSGDWLSAGMIFGLLSEGWKRAIRNKNKVSDVIRMGQRLAAENCKWVGAQGLLYSSHFSVRAHTIMNIVSSFQAIEEALGPSQLMGRPVDFMVPCA